jgi:hypothetical protein
MAAVVKPVKKAVKGAKKVVGEIIEEVIEKPAKKVSKETFDVVFNTTDEERRFILGGTPPPEPEITPEVTPEVVPDDDTVIGRGTRRTKRPGGAGTIMEEYGAISAKPIAKAVERA